MCQNVSSFNKLWLVKAKWFFIDLWCFSCCFALPREVMKGPEPQKRDGWTLCSTILVRRNHQHHWKRSRKSCKQWINSARMRSNCLSQTEGKSVLWMADDGWCIFNHFHFHASSPCQQSLWSIFLHICGTATLGMPDAQAGANHLNGKGQEWWRWCMRLAQTWISSTLCGAGMDRML